jgi:quercetin dioxygenase-like cupin family protein
LSVEGGSVLMADIAADGIFSATVDAAGRPICFPAGPRQIDVTLYEIPSGKILPLHRHPYCRLGYILSGTLRVVNSDTREKAIYSAGDFAVEAIDSWHEGENVGCDPVRILVIDIVEPGAGNVVIR